MINTIISQGGDFLTEKKVNPAKMYLKEFRVIERNLNAHISKYNLYLHNVSKLEEAFDRATRATSRITAVRISGTPSHDGMANAVLDMIEAEEAICQHKGQYEGVFDWILEDMQRLAAEGRERLEMINLLKGDRNTDGETFRFLMFLRYICGMRWEKIAYQMGYSVDNVYKLHGRALAQLNGMAFLAA